MWRLCAAVLVLQLPISEGKSDEPKYDEPEYDEDGMIVRGPFGNAEYDIDLGPGATAAMYLDKALEMGYNSIAINEAGVKVYNLWPNLPEANEFKMNKVLECRISTSCAYIRELEAYLWCDDEGMAKKPVNLLATKLVRETLGQISKDSPGPWHTQKGVILHGVVALIHEKAYERGLEHYRYDEQEL